MTLFELTASTRAVLDAVRAAGGRPIIVGGSVRDALLGSPHSTDIDIEVYGIADHDALAASVAGLGRSDELGAHFGVVTLNVGGASYDLSLPRTESRTGAGHRGFQVVPDSTLGFEAAFARRDFTVNAIGFDPATEELIDPHGGARDLREGLLRHTSAAFAEDPLRVLRGVQFAARFGFTMAEGTTAECRRIVERFHELPTERVWGEWRKIATGGTHISNALKVLVDTGWIRHFGPLDATRGVQQDPRWHPEGDVFTHSGLAADAAAAAAEAEQLDPADRQVAVLGALVHDFGKATHSRVDPDTGHITSHGHAKAGVEPAREFLGLIGAPSSVTTRILPVVAEHMVVAQGAEPTHNAVRRLIRRLEDAGGNIHDWVRVCTADSAGRGPASKLSRALLWFEVAQQLGTTPEPRLLLGEDLIAAGLTPGPRFKSILAASVTAQDAGVFTDRLGAVEWFRGGGVRCERCGRPLQSLESIARGRGPACAATPRT